MFLADGEGYLGNFFKKVYITVFVFLSLLTFDHLYFDGSFGQLYSIVVRLFSRFLWTLR